MYDRKSELEEMLKDANKIPNEINITSIKKSVRKKVLRHRMIKVSRNIAASFLIVLSVFVAGVNISPTFAKAMSGIPLLSKLAEAVDFNEGYKDAVENNYMTEVGQVKETKFGKIKLAYYIADKKSAIFFFEAEDIKKGINKEELGVAVKTIKNTKTGEEVKDIGGMCPSFEKKYAAATIRAWPEDFAYPGHIELTVEISFDGKSELIDYDFSLKKPLKERVYNVNREIQVRKQKINIDKVTVYPTCTYVEYSEDNNNTMDLMNIDFYLVDKKGLERGSKRDITFYDTHGIMIASGYFALGDNISLVVNKVNLLPKDKREVIYDTKIKEFRDCDGVLEYIKIIDDKKTLKKYKGAKEDNEIWFSIDKPEMKGIGNSFSVIDEKTGKEMDTWIGVKWLVDRTVYTMPKSIENDKDKKVKLWREFPEYFEKPDIIIPLK